MKKSELLQNLNPEQQLVVTTTQGPILVLAGAGSGKTRCVIHRVAWLISQDNIPPWNILVVTFTNKAAAELRVRLESIFSSKVKSIWVGTFHAVCVRVLRYEISLLPEYTADFSIYARDDQLSFIKKIMKSEKINTKDLVPEKVLGFISRCKSNLTLPGGLQPFEFGVKQQIYNLYEKYYRLLKKENAMDFDDLLLNVVLLFQQNPDIKEKYQNMFRYIMIDEYQDTNYAQFKIVNLLAESHQNICVVGDDDQAIYGWRGAKIENILSFEKDYRDVQTFRLERNYRSTRNILNLANEIIKQNKNRHKKELWTERISDYMPELISHDDDQGEAHFIVNSLSKKINQGVRPSDIVILYRTNAQSRIFEALLGSRRIAYQVIGGFTFYRRKEIKDILAWLRFLVNQSDMEACFRIINTPPRGVGGVSIEHLTNYIFERGVSVSDALQNVQNIEKLTSTAKNNLTQFSDVIKSIKAKEAELQSLPEKIKMILSECGLRDYYRQIDVADMTDKAGNLDELINASAEFESSFLAEHGKHPNISDYLNTISLQSDIDEYDTRLSSVKLMTLHCVKGLEYDHVYIAGLEDGMLPHFFSMNSEAETEEERRLFYVGITRAKKEIQLHYAQARRVAGTYKTQVISRFLKEIEKNKGNGVIKILRAGAKYERLFGEDIDVDISPLAQSNSAHAKNSFFQIGDKVKHFSLGIGVVQDVQGSHRDAILTIRFDDKPNVKVQGNWVTKL
jgi:DNA helicase-2/ATP-dependent DNA helicase PcrA